MTTDPHRRRCHEAAVIGGGAAGLSAALELKRRGVDVTLLERTDRVGSSWADRYEGLHLNTVRWLSAPRHSRIPRQAGRWPSRESFVQHLRSLEERLGAAVEFETEVSRIEREGDEYAIESATGRRLARYVVVATGYDRRPFLPSWPGLDSFQGVLIHASDYRSPEPFKGKDVLVVGSGNTGTEIAVKLHQGGARMVRMAMRTPPNIVPLEPFGIPITLFGRLSEQAPAPVVDLLGALLQRGAWGDLTSYGLGPVPYGIGTELRVKGLGPVVDRGFVGAVKSGDVHLVAPVVGLDRHAVLLADGRYVEPDAVIAATGYGHGLEPLVGHLGVLAPSGKPACMRGETNSAAPGLFFNGFWLPASGQLPAMRRTTRRIGLEVAHLKAARGPSPTE